MDELHDLALRVLFCSVFFSCFPWMVGAALVALGVWCVQRSLSAPGDDGHVCFWVIYHGCHL